MRKQEETIDHQNLIYNQLLRNRSKREKQSDHSEH